MRKINGIEIIQELTVALAKLVKVSVDDMDKELRREVMDALALGYTAMQIDEIKEESKK
jgi:RNA-binding protein YhbY